MADVRMDIAVLEQRPERGMFLIGQCAFKTRNIEPDVQDCPVRSAYVDEMVRKYRKEGNDGPTD